ncbi:hypothetical protein CASFOL_022977 [Castilleja foliolosa]|uniref:Uncharacterized protein n=1 Tax=Castilleja foliolosa TaxID=1961234 RepID=A0ABD3CTB1_9LAMI
MVKKKVSVSSAPARGGSNPKTSTSGKVQSKKVKVSSSQLEADNTGAVRSNKSGPSLILTVFEPVARVDQAADGAAVPDLEPNEETHLGFVKVKGKEPELDEDGEDSSDDEDGENHPSLISRNGAYHIVKAMKAMNATQQNEITGLGLGLLLQLNAPKELPTKLCYWLVENFEPRTCDLVLRDGGRLHVEAPMLKLFLACRTVIFEWNEGSRVTCKNNLKDCLEMGRRISRTITLFLIAMSTCLMGVTGNGYVPMGLLGNFDNVDVAGNLNLVCYKMSCGSHLALGHYVDRVEDFLRTVDRTFPTMIGWTSKMLYDRLKTEIKFGGFGGGHVAPRFASPETLHHESAKVDPRIGSAGVDRRENCG